MKQCTGDLLESFYRQVLHGSSSDQGAEIEAYRKLLAKRTDQIPVKDWGAGEDGIPIDHRMAVVGKLAQKASRGRKEGELLMRLVQTFQPERILEFGTHLGISGLYLLAGNPEVELTTMEGDPATAQIATETFAQFDVAPRRFIGPFDRLLEQEVNLAELRPDLVFVDGNHRYEATVRYFEQLLPHVPAGAILVFDDINWSPGMQMAWAEIIQHPQVSISIDLFWMGICFVKTQHPKKQVRFRF
ncbi:class I SAM-dependent methyltransferase [Pontibacter sp. G13]|uniref:O-methyltransferase n=1 Tax=Pontibacter sp. G13 TaxID=3074898 RepID=UPI00288C3E4B|nr:class I SAM-dependent methyltransferase [Pontibacter sp. G13]WNJ16749.1 class I SAM-dependent methyltransferase [Pontibacter sp. G13]